MNTHQLIVEIYEAQPVQDIIERIATKLYYKYSDKHLFSQMSDKDELKNEAFVMFFNRPSEREQGKITLGIVEGYNGLEYINSVDELPQPLLAHISTNVENKLKDYIHKQCNIKRIRADKVTTRKYHEAHTEFDPEFHGGELPSHETNIINADWVDSACFHMVNQADVDIIEMEYFMEMDKDSIVQTLGVTDGTYRKRKFTAMNRMREALQLTC